MHREIPQLDGSTTERRAMTMDIEGIKIDLLSATERGDSVDIGEWVRRFPEHREAILDFWLWAQLTNSLTVEDLPDIASLPSVHKEALHRACLAASLGADWLRPLAVEKDVGEVASAVQGVRRRPVLSLAANRRSFHRAVVYAWVIDQLSTVRDAVTRLAVQKTVFLLEEALELHLFDSHLKKPKGPYDHDARYRDAEPIAVKKGWIAVKGAILCAGANTAELQRYVDRYLRSTSLALTLTRWLGRLADDQLETLATVQWIASRQGHKRGSLTATTVREELARDPEWVGKLRKANFSVESVSAALASLLALGILGEK